MRGNVGSNAASDTQPPNRCEQCGHEHFSVARYLHDPNAHYFCKQCGKRYVRGVRVVPVSADFSEPPTRFVGPVNGPSTGEGRSS